MMLLALLPRRKSPLERRRVRRQHQVDHQPARVQRLHARVHLCEIRPVGLVGRKERLRARRHDESPQVRELLSHPRLGQAVERGPVHRKEIRVVVAHPQMRRQTLRVNPEVQIRRPQEPMPAALRCG
jgi:hypothetical protein